MTSCPELELLAGRVLRGEAAAAVPAARLGTELHSVAGGRAVEEAAERARTAARAEGYAVGWAEGLRAAAEHASAAAAVAEAERLAQREADAASVRDAVRALADAAAALEARAVAPAAELRDAVLAAALELAQALIGRELEVAAAPGLDALRRALTSAPTGRPVTARFNPADAPAVRAAVAELGAAELGRDVIVLTDPQVSRGGCVADCDATRIDAQLDTALARVRKVLAQG